MHIVSKKAKLQEKKTSGLEKAARIVKYVTVLGVILAAIILGVVLYLNNRYIYYYNKGNAFYEKGDYISAIPYYEKALSCYVPEYKECDIRVNLVLAKMYTTKIKELKSMESATKEEREAAWEEIVEMAKEGIRILAEDGCATEEGTPGHDTDAQKLMDELKELLESQGGSGGSSDDEQENDGSQGDDEDDESQDALDALEDAMNQGNEARQELEESQSDEDEGVTDEWYDYYGDPW